MLFEKNSWYQNSLSTPAHNDPEMSVPKHEISKEDAEEYMKILDMMRIKRIETERWIIYDQRIDCRHGVEYIFWK